MLRLVSDENFNGDIVRGLFRRYPELELGYDFNSGNAGQVKVIASRGISQSLHPRGSRLVKVTLGDAAGIAEIDSHVSDARG
jgi:hypothetical protein